MSASVQFTSQINFVSDSLSVLYFLTMHFSLIPFCFLSAMSLIQLSRYLYAHTPRVINPERHPCYNEHPTNNVEYEYDVGERLLLTPYLENGEIDKARELSIVDPESLMENITSHAGYLTVNKAHNSHLWFWYFPVQEGIVSEVPFIIWLQGGPGSSSLCGLFEEIGPFKVDHTGEHLIANEFSWHLTQSVLFIDNPVGTGFSVTDYGSYAKNETIIGEQLYDFLTQFYQIFHELQTAPLFIAGESYAGKYIPSLAYEIHKNKPMADVKINLQGISIGNGFIDPEHMTGFGDFLYQFGFIDDNVLKVIRKHELQCVDLIKQQKYSEAYECRSIMYEKHYLLSTGLYNLYDARTEVNLTMNKPYYKFIQNPKIRKALHVGKNIFCELKMAYYELTDDVPKSYKFQLEEILEHYRVMLYNGQFDVLITYPMLVNMIKNLKWSGAEEYLNAPRKKWIFDNIFVAGYTKKVGNLLEILVRNAGHSAIVSQPERLLTMMKYFIKNEPLPEYII